MPDREDHAPESAPAQLLEGTCSLAFETQEFAPAGGRTTLWLNVSNEVRLEVARRLGIDAAVLDGPEQFYAKFLGRVQMSGSGWGCGHLGCYPGSVTVDELIDARFLSGRPAQIGKIWLSGG